MSNDIIVIGRLLPLSFLGGTGAGGGGAGGDRANQYSGFYGEVDVDWDGGGGEVEPGATPPVIGLEPVNPIPNEIALRQAMARFAQTIQNLHVKLGNLPMGAPFTASNGAQVTLDELYGNWLYLDFEITFTKDYPANWGGAVRGSPEAGGWLSSMKDITLTGYDAHGDGGRNYLALHELAHTTVAVTSYFNEVLTQYRDNGGDPLLFSQAPQFAQVENYTNQVAQWLAGEMAVPVMPNPPHGY